MDGYSQDDLDFSVTMDEEYAKGVRYGYKTALIDMQDWIAKQLNGEYLNKD